MYKKRTLQLFYILASAPDEYRTSKELSEMANVTDRTIKGDIRELSNLAYDLGARIISHKGKGYRLEIEDEEVFKNAYEQLEYHFYSNYINDDVIENRVIDILRLLVTSENYMTVDDIADDNSNNPMGVLGNRFSTRYRIVQLLENFYKQQTNLFYDEDYKQQVKLATDDIYNYQFIETTKTVLGRMLAKGESQEDIVEAVLDFRKKGVLCRKQDNSAKDKSPKILCSMGLSRE